MKKVAIIGTQGVPARYGGFETLVENIIGENVSSEIEYTIFCSSKDIYERTTIYKKAVLKYIPLHANGIQSIFYDIISMICCIKKGYETILILGVSGCLFLPIFRCFFRKKIIVNIDGLEHRREKWGTVAKRFLKWSEAMAVSFADCIIVDNKGIQKYVNATYSKQTVLIAYGGDHVKQDVTVEEQKEILKKYTIKQEQYAMALCRIEPENNCYIILEAFVRSGEDLVFIGNWKNSKYSNNLYNRYKSYKNIHLINSLYDLKELYSLRNHCKWYIHGHSAGGTNPSLVEAMFFNKPIFAFDVIYNRETTFNKAHYFKDISSLIKLQCLPSKELIKNKKCMNNIAEKYYLWKNISKQYEKLY